MAVYTEVTDEALSAFLAGYDLGRVLSFKGIAEGVENSNFLLITAKGPFILTLYEKRVHEGDLPFFIGLMEHLALARRHLPATGAGAQRRSARPLGGALGGDRDFSRRSVVAAPSSAALRPGRRGARAHARGRRRFRASPAQCALHRGLAAAVRRGRSPGRRSLARPRRGNRGGDRRIARVSGRPNLPSGVIHADLFPDNVFFLGERLSGLIDFYFACNDFFAYDLGVCLNAWCFEPDGDFNVSKGMAMIEGYQRVRRLTSAEVEALPILARGSALRFMLTRLVDWLERAARRPGRAERSAGISGQAALSPTRRQRARLRLARLTPAVAIWTDGACSGNPGPGGWGAILCYGDRARRTCAAARR